MALQYTLQTAYASNEPVTSTEAPIAAEKTVETTAAEGEKQGVAGTLGINGLLLAGQLVNFAIVLFILWKFVFGPIGKKLQERSEKVSKSMQDAATVEKEKQEFALWRDQEMGKARKEASAIVTVAQTDAQKAKDAALQQTKDEQQKLFEQAKKQIETEKNQQLQSAKAELADIITQATEKILRTKLDKNKDQELIKDSLKSL